MTKRHVENPTITGSLTRDWLAGITDICNSVRSFVGGPGVLVSHGQDGVKISLSRVSRPAGSSVQRFVIVSESDDTLSCKAIDAQGNQSDDETTIAKPWELRGATATKTDSGDTANIDPAYDAGGSIAAVVISGGTGISGVTYLDLNVDARAWVWDC